MIFKTNIFKYISRNRLIRFFPIWAFMLVCLPSLKAGITFIENKGQWEPQVLYRADIPGGKLYLEKGGLTYFFYDEAALHEHMHDNKPITELKNHVVRVGFEEGNINLFPAGELQVVTRYNYFLGNEQSRWASNVPAYNTIIYKEIWPGIDLEIDGHEDVLKYNFIVKPGADPDKIKLLYKGAQDIVLNDGQLEIHTSLATIREEKPFVYQPGQMAGPDGSSPVTASYKITDGNRVSFKIGSYNKKDTLTIDPLVVFATFSGSTADNFGFTATYNKQGNTFSGGTVYGPGYPTRTGAFLVNFQGGEDNFSELEYARDAGILKFSEDGSRLLWATYLGGKNNEQPHSMVVNSAGNLVILGTTRSNNFPVTSGCYDNSYNGGGDIYVCILSTDGSTLLKSTYFGGSGRDGLNGDNPSNYPTGPLAYNYGDQYRGEVIVDENDNILIATCTQSFNFPVKDGFQMTYGGGAQDGCVARFNPDLSTLQFASYIGGSKQDAAYGINLDRTGNIFVCGGTESNNFKTISSSAFPFTNGERDGFLIKLAPSGNQLLSATYVGTSQYDQAYFVQLDNFDRVYVTGQTEGNFPVTPGVYGVSGGKQFIMIFDNELKSVYRSTVFGSGRSKIDLSPSAFLVDLCGRVYVSGWGGGTNNQYNQRTGNTFSLPVTNDAYQKTTDGSDFYLIIISRELNSLVYASYFGGPVSEEHVDGGTSRFDRDGKVYQSVCGGCGGYSDFPTTANAWSRRNLGRRPHNQLEGGCNNAVFKIDLNSSNFAPQFLDTTLVVFANEEINYSFNIIDPDVVDSIYIQYSSDIFDPKKTPSPSAIFKADSGIGNIQAKLYWQTTCKHASLDTYYVKIVTRDNGCPTPRTYEGYIKIVVKEPPLPKRPDIFCLSRINEHTVRLDWSWEDAFNDKFLKEYRLVKTWPDGNEKIIKTFTGASEPFYTDEDAANHLTQDYCYFIYGINICDKKGDSTRKICSIPDKDSIPPKVDIYTVTVENNRDIRVFWNKYPREDYYYYKVFRKRNKAGEDFVLYTTIRDQQHTTFLDTNVNVQAYSYCYKVVVQTQCGLASPEANYGCSILLTGRSIPFEHYLHWNGYRQWKNGVAHYEIMRSDPLTPMALVGADVDTSFLDDKLNYDVGLYYYHVVAFEKDGNRAASVSNEIELYQEPILRVPNAFSPNNDSLNDRWRTVPVFVKDYHMKIFNRWGQFVWETDDKHNLWKGIYNEFDPFMNVFIWQVEYTGWEHSKYYRHGNVTLIK